MFSTAVRPLNHLRCVFAEILSFLDFHPILVPLRCRAATCERVENGASLLCEPMHEPTDAVAGAA